MERAWWCFSISDAIVSLSYVLSMYFIWMDEALTNTSQLIPQQQNLVRRMFLTTGLVPAILI